MRNNSFGNQTNLIKNLFFLAILFLSNAAFAQKEETVLGSGKIRMTGIWGGNNHQITRFGNTNTFTSGGTFGFEFNKAFSIGWMHNAINDVVNWNNDQNRKFDMKWNGVAMAYGMNKFKAVHPIFTLDAGRGVAKLQNEGEQGHLFVLQPGVGIEFNIFRWFHLNLSGGYRMVNGSEFATLTDQSLSGAFGQVGLRFGWSWGRSNRHNTKD